MAHWASELRRARRFALAFTMLSSLAYGFHIGQVAYPPRLQLVANQVLSGNNLRRDALR